MVYKNGGAVFLIPYFCALIFIAVPMYFIETAFGQLIVCKLHQRYAIIKPHWWAVAVCQVMICFATCIYYITLMAWSFSFFFDAFKSQLPWMNEGAEAATSAENLLNYDFFYEDTLHVSSGIAN